MNNKVIRRIKKEWTMKGTILAGYPRKTSSKWYYMCRRDTNNYRGIYSKEQLAKVHAKGFLAKNIERLGMEAILNGERISDLDYLYLQPFNNNYAKWINDLNTMHRVLPKFDFCMPKIYFSIFNRNGLHILSYPVAKKRIGTKDIVALLKSKKELWLIPAFFESKGEKYVITYVDSKHVKIGQKVMTIVEFTAFFRKLTASYLICDRICFDYKLTSSWCDKAYFKFYIANDSASSGNILCAVANVFKDDSAGTQFALNCADGSFIYNGEKVQLPNWDKIKNSLTELAIAVKEIGFFTISIVITKEGFLISNCSTNPVLPRIMPSKELNDYLLQKVKKKKSIPLTTEQKLKAIKDSQYKKHVEKDCKKGIRPYMQKLWDDAVKSDKKWKGTTKAQKKWAWERGYLSFRIDQYGLTEDNYKDFLSDYQYHWLNRINGVYQGWVNDKVTFRYVMQPLKEYVASYYFSVYKVNGKTVIHRMLDCPDNIETSFSGVAKLLKEVKKLAFKAAAGTHGDGFYAFEYLAQEDKYLVNGVITSETELENIIFNQKSFYVITSYIEMNEEIKKIFPQSVNSIRMMVINTNGYNPKIMQTYMRIGSSKTGFTDNVGYGGICAMINMETGELYNPETLRDHVYYPCPQHPDTGVSIEGIKIPHWEKICQTVLQVSRSMPELEYLGFDVAVTEDSLIIMEINIHQDLHKVALYSDEIMEFFRSKIRYKEWLNGLPKSV